MLSGDISNQQIETALSCRNFFELVGIGAIVDPNHPCKKRQTSRPRFLPSTSHTRKRNYRRIRFWESTPASCGGTESSTTKSSEAKGKEGAGSVRTPSMTEKWAAAKTTRNHAYEQGSKLAYINDWD